MIFYHNVSAEVLPVVHARLATYECMLVNICYLLLVAEKLRLSLCTDIYILVVQFSIKCRENGVPKILLCEIRRFFKAWLLLHHPTKRLCKTSVMGTGTRSSR